jgi:signal transduction histidine kinase/CheY-like chemotaxis protein
MEDLTLVTQLRNTLGRLEAALGAVEEGLAFTDLDGTVEWTNAAFDRFVGRSRLQCLGVNLATLLPERYQDGRSQPADCLLFWARNGTGRANWDLSPSPPRRVFEVSWATVNVPSKPSLIFTFRDQSAIVQAQDALIQARDQLELQVEERTRELEQARDAALAASQTKTRFLASMSHEIRTPMNAVIGMTELLLDSQLVPNQREMVTTIQSSGEHLLSVINDILDISQIETGRMLLNVRAFDLLALLNDCRVLFKHQAAARRLAMEVQIPPGTPRWVLGDDLKLRQILFNLLGNACKYTNAGTISLSVETVQIAAQELQLTFRVADTGIGIPADNLPSIFEEFSRRPNPSQTTQSAGLGLAICQRLCNLMGGEISVQSFLNQGSCFTVQLPFGVTQEPHQETAYRASVSNLDTAQNIQILVADDSRVNQRVLELMLGRLDLKAELVADGEAAIKRITAGGIELVFMDVEMPRLDGLAATRKLRAAGFTDIYIIALTAYSYSSHRLDCEAAGMNDFLAKPLRNEDLCTALEHFREYRRKRHHNGPG